MAAAASAALAGQRLIPLAFRLKLYREIVGIDIGENTFIGHDVSMGNGIVKIGRDCYINQGCILDPGDASITIEDGVALAVRVIMVAVAHNDESEDSRCGEPYSVPIIIGTGSWLGAGVIVLPGVTVAPGCVITPGSVLNRDTLPNGVYAGIPARRVRDLPVKASLAE